MPRAATALRKAATCRAISHMHPPAAMSPTPASRAAAAPARTCRATSSGRLLRAQKFGGGRPRAQTPRYSAVRNFVLRECRTPAPEPGAPNVVVPAECSALPKCRHAGRDSDHRVARSRPDFGRSAAVPALFLVRQIVHQIRQRFRVHQPVLDGHLHQPRVHLIQVLVDPAARPRSCTLHLATRGPVPRRIGRLLAGRRIDSAFEQPVEFRMKRRARSVPRRASRFQSNASR